MDSPSLPLNDSFAESPISTYSHPLHPVHGASNIADRNHINILTYNIFLRPPPVKNNASDHKDDRLKEFIQLLPEFDIICLQEMFGFINKRKHKLIRCATKAGFLYYADSSSPSFFSSFVVDGGLLVLSRFPILASEFKPYPYGIFSDALAQKGVLYTKIQVKDEILHLYNTHTQASYVGSNQRYSIITRSDQFTMMRQFITTTLKKNNYKEGEMVLLAGDFNVDSKHPLIETEKVKTYPGFKEYPYLGANDYFNEYHAMKCHLSDNFKDDIEDLLEQTYGEHPITYGDTYMTDSDKVEPLETVLTDKDDLCSNQSLDYIFRLHPKTLVSNEGNDLEEGMSLKKKGKLHIPEGSARVEKFFVDGQVFTQLSDHYGCMVTLDYIPSGKKGYNTHQQQAQQSHEKIIVLE